MDNINLSGPSEVTKKPVVGSENSNSRIEESKPINAKVNPVHPPEQENTACTVEAVPDRVIQGLLDELIEATIAVKPDIRDDPSIPEEGADDPGDLYEEDGEDTEIIHMKKDRHGRLVEIDTPPMSEYEKIRERAIGKQQHLKKFKTVFKPLFLLAKRHYAGLSLVTQMLYP